jgi:hypothetical protein
MTDSETLPSKQFGRSKWGKHFQWRTVALAAIAAIVASGLTGCGGSSTETTAARSSAAQPPSSTKTETVIRPNPTAPFYRLTGYDVETTWDQDASEKKIGRYLENSWHDPAAVNALLVIDSQASNGAVPPLAAAKLARAQTGRLPAYHERSFKKVKIGGHPAVRWAYSVADEGYVEYFFAQCGTSIHLHGSTAVITFKDFADYYRGVASGLKVACEKSR